jgi:hypothetical protein
VDRDISAAAAHAPATSPFSVSLFRRTYMLDGEFERSEEIRMRALFEYGAQKRRKVNRAPWKAAIEETYEPTVTVTFRSALW